jgi:sucrose-6-phosphate hydrolase SacC (GH32 family)
VTNLESNKVNPGESEWKGRQLCDAVSKDGIAWKLLEFLRPDEDADAKDVSL